MSRGARNNGSKTRVVLYSFPGDTDFAFDVEARLACAKRDGIIVNYDDGRDRCPWFEGSPGARLRALRDEFRHALRRAS